jgi:hypothetical protein
VLKRYWDELGIDSQLKRRAAAELMVSCPLSKGLAGRAKRAKQASAATEPIAAAGAAAVAAEPLAVERLSVAGDDDGPFAEALPQLDGVDEIYQVKTLAFTRAIVEAFAARRAGFERLELLPPAAAGAASGAAGAAKGADEMEIERAGFAEAVDVLCPFTGMPAEGKTRLAGRPNPCGRLVG